jgi:hypothetical protein
MSQLKFRENISDKGLRKFFNDRNNTPNKRYKEADYTRLRNQYFKLLDAYRAEQKKIKAGITNAFARLDRQFKSNKKSFSLDLDYLRELKLPLADIVKRILKSYSKSNKPTLMKIGGTQYALNPNTRERLFKYVENNFVNYEDTTESDGQVVTNISENPTIRFDIIELKHKNKKQSGKFFPYYHKLNNLDLTKYGIYSSAEQLSEEKDKVCFVKALRMSGLNDEKYAALLVMVKSANVPFSQIEQICNTLSIQIRVKRLNQNNPQRDWFGKDFTEIYHIGMIEEHYFVLDTAPITHYAIDNFEQVKDTINWNTFKNATIRDRSKCINSFVFVQELLKHQDRLLTRIPYKDLAATPFYKMYDNEFPTLNYDMQKCCKLVNEEKEREENEMMMCYATGQEPKIKLPKQEYLNVFFDFETYTNNDLKHIPYLCCALIANRNEPLSFIGEDCGLQMLKYISSIKCDFVRLIAHNATYDYQFIVKYLTKFSEITRGNRMLSAKGMFGKVHLQIKCSYHLISMPLSKFGKTFKLDQAKEVMPYGIYNENDNVKKRFIQVNLVLNGNDKYGHAFLKDNQKKQFSSNLEKWNLIKKDGTYDIIEYSKKYCEMDCIVLRNGYNTFRKWILQLENIDTNESLELDINDIMTSASLAHRFMIKNGCYNDVYQLSGVPQQFIQKCVVGGRTMLANNKATTKGGNKKVGDFDGVSLYPSAMNRMRGFLTGKPIPFNKPVKYEKRYETLGDFDGWFVEVRINNIRKHRAFPLLSYVNEKGIRIFSNDMKGRIVYLDGIQLEDAIEFHELKSTDFEILRGYIFKSGVNDKINKTIKYLFNTRLEKKNEPIYDANGNKIGKGNPCETIYKLIMNSAYGKSILKEQEFETKYFDKQEEYDVFLSRNYEWIECVNKVEDSNIIKVKVRNAINEHQNIAQVGVSVLSWSKRIMNEVMCLAEDSGCEIFYQDTDSMHMYQDDIPKLSAAFTTKYNRDLIGENLGQFHSDFEIEYDDENGNKRKCKDVYSRNFVGLGKKCYIDELIGTDHNGKEIIDYHIRMKGVSNSTLEYELKQEIKKENPCYENMLQMYMHLYEGNSIDFDLTEGMGKSRFKISKSFGVETIDKFSRQIKFIV